MRQRKWASRVRCKTPISTISPTVRDLAWAAGFIDGEGSFLWNGSSEMISVPQKDKELLVKLQTLFGGGLTARPTKYGYRMNVWQVYGARARGVAMTLYSFMSDRRKAQIGQMLAAERMV